MPDTGPFGSIKAFIYGLLYRNPKSNRAVVDLARLQPDDHVLDIGCGAGAALLRAAEVIRSGTVAGIDPTPELAELASSRLPAAEIKQAGVEAIPFADDTFTVAWSISAFHHWPNRPAGLGEVRRVVRPEGRFLLAERLLTKRGTHGLDEMGLELAAAQLGDAGFERVARTDIRVGRRTMTVLAAS